MMIFSAKIQISGEKGTQVGLKKGLTAFQIKFVIFPVPWEVCWQQRNSYRMTTLAAAKESDARTICRKNTTTSTTQKKAFLL